MAAPWVCVVVNNDFLFSNFAIYYVSLYGDQVESFKQDNNVHKSCDTIPLRHLKWFCSTFKIKHIKYCRTKFQLETQKKIISSMSASEHFLKYFLEKRKNINNFFF